MASIPSKKNFEVMPLVKLHPSRSRFAGEILLTDRTIRKHSVLKDVQGIGLDLLPEYHKSSVIDEKYKSVEDMEVILLSETILGHVKDQTGFLPAFVYQIVGLQPRGTKSKRLVECPYQILRDEALSFPYDTSFRRAALNVEFQPQFDVLDAPWILDQCLRYRQMLEMNDMMECKQRRLTGVTQVTHRYPVETRRESRYDVTTRRMEYSRVEPYSSSRRVRSYTAKSGPDSVFKDLLTGFYGTAFYGSGYCSTYGGYPLYGYNYIGKPYSSIHGLYGDSHLSSSTGGQQESTLMTVTETTTSAFDRDKYRYPTLASLPPPPPYVPRTRLSTQQSVTEVTTTTTTTTEKNEEQQQPEITKKRPEIIIEKTFEVREPEQKKRPEIIIEKTYEVREPEQKRWKTITEEIIETTIENEPKPKVEEPEPVPKIAKRVKPKPQQMVTICTYDSKQGANSDPLFQASTTRTILKKESIPEVHHGTFTHSAPPPLDIEPVPAAPVVRNATHYYKVDDDEEGEVKTMKKPKTIPEVKVRRETTITTTKLPPPQPPQPEPKIIYREPSNEDVSFEEYSTIFQPVLQKASSYPDLQQENRAEHQPNPERSKSLHHLSPQDSSETIEPEEEMNQSTDSITYVFVNRAQSLNSMTAEKGNKKNQLLRPVSEPDWEVINGRESRSGFPSKDTSDTCIQTSGSLENLYLNDYSEESTTYTYKSPRKQSPQPPSEKTNVRVINITPENHAPHKKVESEPPHRPKEIRYIMYDDAPQQHHRQPTQQGPNIVYKIIARDDDEPEENIPDTNHHIEIRKRSHHYRDADVKESAIPEEEAILSIARAYLSDNMASVANHVQRVNGTDSIYYGENRVIVVDQQRQIGDKKSASNAPRAELQIILPSRNRGKNLNNVNVGLRDRQISEIIDSYLKNRHLEKQETEGTEKNHKYQIVSSDHSSSAPDESSVFVIHDNGSTHDSNGSSRHHRVDGLDRMIYSRDKDGVEHGYRVGYTNDIHGAVNIYIHEVPPRVVHDVPRVEVTKVRNQLSPHPSNVNHNVTIHVKHDKEEPIKKHVFHHLQERTRINDSMNTLDLSFSSSGEEEKPTKGWSDELEKLRLERLKILSLVGKESETSKLQMEATEANLNYLNGQTDSLLTTIDTDDLRPLPMRTPRPNRPVEEVEYEYNIVKKHYHQRDYVDPDAAIDDKLAELDLNQRNNAAAKQQQQQLSRLNFTAPNLQLQSSMNMGAVEPLGDIRRHQRSLSSGIIDKLPILPPSPNRLSRTMTSSREFLPFKFPTSPTTAAKKSWMNLNTNLFKASTAALQDAHRIVPTMGQYLNTGAVRSHNVMRRSSLKGGNSPYYVRNGGMPRPRMGVNIPAPLSGGMQDYNLESPTMSSVSTAPYFRYDEFTPGNLHELSRGVVPQLNLNALRPNSQERLYFPTINPEFNYLDESGRLQMVPQATSGSGRFYPTHETGMTGGGTGHSIHCDHPSHAMDGQRLNSTYSPRKFRMSQEQIGHTDCPICHNTNDVTNIMKNDTQSDEHEIRHFSPTFDKFSNRYQPIFEPPRYDEISHSSSSRDSAFFSDPNALSGSSHYFQDVHHTGQSGMPHPLTRQPGYFSPDGGRQRGDHNVRVHSTRQMTFK